MLFSIVQKNKKKKREKDLHISEFHEAAVTHSLDTKQTQALNRNPLKISVQILVLLLSSPVLCKFNTPQRLLLVNRTTVISKISVQIT